MITKYWAKGLRLRIYSGTEDEQLAFNFTRHRLFHRQERTALRGGRAGWGLPEAGVHV